MGIFDSITKGVKQLGSDVAGGLNLLSSAFVKPVDTISSLAKFAVNPNKENAQSIINVVNQSKAMPLSSSISRTVATTGVAAAAIVSAPIVAPTAAKAVSNFVTNNPGKTAIAITAAVPVTAALIQSPKAREAVVSAPSSLANFGSNVGQLIENPSISNATNIFKENPIVASTIVAGAAIATGAASAGVISTLLNTKAVKENTAAMGPQLISSNVPVTMTSLSPSESKNAAVPVTATVPSGTLTASSSGASTKKKKKKKKSKKKKVYKKKKSSKKKKKRK